MNQIDGTYPVLLMCLAFGAMGFFIVCGRVLGFIVAQQGRDFGFMEKVSVWRSRIIRLACYTYGTMISLSILLPRFDASDRKIWLFSLTLMVLVTQKRRSRSKRNGIEVLPPEEILPAPLAMRAPVPWRHAIPPHFLF